MEGEVYSSLSHSPGRLIPTYYNIANSDHEGVTVRGNECVTKQRTTPAASLNDSTKFERWYSLGEARRERG
jgi:hypothetical protein